jgi:phage baseplate assembly protein W
MPTGLAVQIPLILDEEDGPYKLIKEYGTLVRQNFKMLLFTNPGERLMDANFGVGMRRFLFENASFSTLSEISSKISEQTAKYMPFLEIDDIDFADTDLDSNFLHVKITYTISPLSVTDILEEVIQEDANS